LVVATCFAELGHDVVVCDVVVEKIEALKVGAVPIPEPGLNELLAKNRQRLTFTSSAAAATEGADFLYVAVGTPPTAPGNLDLAGIWAVVYGLSTVGGSPVLVMKSTVPVGTGAKVRASLDARGLAHVVYVSNPEFFSEGTAIRDFFSPQRVVVGAFGREEGDRVAALYAVLDAPVVRCDVASAEMIKLAANAFLTTRISFINEIANVCELVGADVKAVARPAPARCVVGDAACRKSRRCWVRAVGAVLLQDTDHPVYNADTGRDREWLWPVGVDRFGRADDEGLLVDALDAHRVGPVAFHLTLTQ